MSLSLTIFQLAVLLFSVMIHEIAHGVVALRLGDTTARDQGRLTLNPLVHIDPFGSIILPVLLFISSGGAFVFGWAKPVPYDPRFLTNPKRGAGLIALAGPVSNLVVAIVLGLFLRFFSPLLLDVGLGMMIQLMSLIVFINILLAVFNLVPLPPLDGSKVLYALLPDRYYYIERFLEQYGLILLLFFIFFGFDLILPIVRLIYILLV